MRRFKRGTRLAGLMAGGYLLLASVYIVVSDNLAARLSASVQELHVLEHYKGLAFVAVTGLGVFLANRWAFNRLDGATAELLRRERALLDTERRVFAGLLAASIAHDANNVLVLVLADLDDLKERAAPADAETLVSLEAAVNRLVSLNRRLVLATRNGTAPTPESLELASAVEEAVELARAHGPVRTHDLRFVGEGEERVLVAPLLLQQVVTNLVVNAAEASGDRGHVEVRVRREGSEVLLEVHDDGPGVPLGRRADLFEALTTTKPDGNGLGLFSVKACATAMGGQVEVGDSPLGGACFRVRLPLEGSAVSPT
jgi:signal transduction histidine kinase